MTGSGPVLVVEPYFGGSHRVWAEGIREHLGLPVQLATMPPRWWKWRMRGAAVTVAEQLSLPEPPSAVLVSDMIDLPAFQVFAADKLDGAPIGLYFHESQLTYPDSPQMEPDLSYGLTNWLSALAADRVFFNSGYHRDVFFAELPRLLRHFPDFTHEHRIDEVRDRAEVLEVGIDLSWAAPPARQGPLRLVWNHRWEHDKDPLAFFDAIDTLAEEGLEFEVVVLGENYRVRPVEFETAARRHPDRIVHMGYADVADYRTWLLQSDVVVSTALHEFFGVAIVEGIAAGCMPVLPARLSYPEIVPAEWHEACLYPPGALADYLRPVIRHPEEARRVGRAVAPTLQRFDWSAMAPRYLAAVESLIAMG